MTEREFKTLLATYFDGHLSDEELVTLETAVQEEPTFRTLFQAELRLHTLLREGARARLELAKLSVGTALRARLGRMLRTRLPLLAAACLALALMILLWPGRPGDLPGPTMGTCLSVTGDAVIERDQTRVALHVDTPIQQGDRIVSALRADSLVRLVDGTVFSLAGGSAVRIDRTASHEIEIVLERGEAVFEVNTRRLEDGRVLVRTPQATATVLGTSFVMEAQPTTTRLKVYKGLVHFRQVKTRETVTVGGDQYTETGPGPLHVREIPLPPRVSLYAQLVLSPIDDAYIQEGAVVNQDHLYLEGQRRIAYMRFNIPDIGAINGATLQLTQWKDSGSGTIRFYRGSRADWTEQDFVAEKAPEPEREVARYTGFVGPRQVVEVDVSDAIQGPGFCTIIMTLDTVGNDDISFGSRESDVGPRLVINLPQSGS
mgnify:CR=1 FL=1